jgi:hypothetical protein
MVIHLRKVALFSFRSATYNQLNTQPYENTCAYLGHCLSQHCHSFFGAGAGQDV